jgi:hypothetical protein
MLASAVSSASAVAELLAVSASADSEEVSTSRPPHRRSNSLFIESEREKKVGA